MIAGWSWGKQNQSLIGAASLSSPLLSHHTTKTVFFPQWQKTHLNRHYQASAAAVRALVIILPWGMAVEVRRHLILPNHFCPRSGPCGNQWIKEIRTAAMMCCFHSRRQIWHQETKSTQSESLVPSGTRQWVWVYLFSRCFLSKSGLSWAFCPLLGLHYMCWYIEIVWL